MHSLPSRAVGDRAPEPLCVRRLGVRAYDDACALQERAARRVGGGGPDELLFVAHPPVVTLGRAATAAQVLVDKAELARRGISVIDSDRGGGATYHGPGQLVGYPIVSLRRRGVGVRGYLRAVEAALVGVLRDQGVLAFARPGLTGVWSGGGKLASIGVSVRRGVTRHGFALNLDGDLEPFAHIVPCGLREPVTSLGRLGWQGSRARLMGDLAAALAAVLASTGAPQSGAAPAGVVAVSR